MAYRVVAPSVVVLRRTANGILRDIAYENNILPADAAVESVQVLLSMGMVTGSPDPVITPPTDGTGAAIVAAQASQMAAQAQAAASGAQLAADAAASQAAAAIADVATAQAQISPALAQSLADRAQLNTRMMQREQAEATIAERIDSLEGTTGGLKGEVSDLRDALAAIELTPGPQGDPGEDATDEQVSASVAAYLAAHPPAAGADGRSAELRVFGGNVEWRQSGGSWQTLVPLAVITGPQGVVGGQGVKGDTGAAGQSAWQAWLAAGNTGTQAQFLASLVGAQGIAGIDGKSVELRNSGTAIQWRQVGGTWADLVLLSAITGPAGTTGTAGKDAVVIKANKVNLPALSIGANPIPITWATTAPNTTYDVVPVLTASETVLGSLRVGVKAGSQTTTGCTLVVTSTALLGINSGALGAIAYP